MADLQISELTALATPAAADLVVADKADGSATGYLTLAQAITAATAAGGGTVGRLVTPRANQTALSASTDNWAVTAAALNYFSVTAAYNITGMVAGATDERRTFINNGSFTATLKHDQTSTAANRFLTITGGDLAVAAGEWFEAIYDATAARWRVA